MLYLQPSNTELSYMSIIKHKMSHSPIKQPFEIKLSWKKLLQFQWIGLELVLLVLIFSPLPCNCSIMKEQLVARCHRKTLFPICYSHMEQKLQELEVNYDGESLRGEREGERRETNELWSRAGKVNFHRCCFCVVLQLVMNERQRALSWRRMANGIVLHQSRDSWREHTRLLLFFLNAMPC